MLLKRSMISVGFIGSFLMGMMGSQAYAKHHHDDFAKHMERRNERIHDDIVRRDNAIRDHINRRDEAIHRQIEERRDRMDRMREDRARVRQDMHNLARPFGPR